MASTVGSRAFQNARLQKKMKKQAETVLPAAYLAYRQGRQADVQALCRQLLAEFPDFFDALHLLGVSLVESSRIAEALPHLERAVGLEPRSADAQSNLGFALFNLERHAEARIAIEQALALNPNFPTAQRNLGNVLLRLKQAEGAIAAFSRAIALNPGDADSWCNRGVAELMLKHWAAAAANSERALALRPQHFEALVNKGLSHLELRHYDVAEAAFNAAIAVRPDNAEVLAHRGRLQLLMGRRAAAEADFDAAVAGDPTLDVAWQGKAQVCMFNSDIGQAMVACKRVLEQNPVAEVALMLLGQCLGRLGDVAGALAHFDRVIEINPDYDEAITKKIFYLDFLSEADFAIQQATRKQWWEVAGSKLPRRQLSPRSLDPHRRIVLGYVSSDFRTHSAAFAFLPVLRGHDKAQFQINCYSSSTSKDGITDMIQSLADVWVDAMHMSDDELADRIQADNVDILIDLSGFTSGNRIPVFARKPAPVQVTAWGSGTGTGLATMDYFFADPVTIPQEVRHLFAEEVFDLPSVITIDPISAAPTPLPMLRNGHVTFGVFNRIDKISDEALAVWARLLDAVAGSKLVVKHLALNDPTMRDGLLGRFASAGVGEDRIICMGASERADHLRAFAEIDIALDPFPQNGGISTWEALYMGVPVIAKLGRGASSRAAGAIVKAIGLDDWVAEDDDGYVEIAKAFATNPAYLGTLRAELPSLIAQSDAGNVAVYGQRVEQGYRQFWQTYCAKASTPK